MRAMSSIPPKKDRTVIQFPIFSPRSEVRESWAFTKISIMETYTMTPAENPRLTERNFRFVCLVKNAIPLPIPVLRPASRVRRNASKIEFIVRLLSES